ncbi:hypothetical protein F5Y14DRAFT_428075 [Nemania sp. NC0429]|nr:hypothetical protein F5Y14DRAFT_428075 [Nemania sp. NC0429]
MHGPFDTTSIGQLTIILGWVLTALALLSVILYMWSKTVRDMSVIESFDDILLYLSFILALALMCLTTWAVLVEGQGRHQSAESRSQIERIAKSLLINEILWSIVNTFLRIAAIRFIRKLCAISKDSLISFHGLTIILLVVSIAYLVVVVAISLAICQPISKGWDPTVKGTCGNEILAYICLELISLVIDLAIVIAPLPVIMKLHMSLVRRLGVSILLSLGSVVFIITALRIASLNRVNSQDFSYDRGYLGLLSILGPLITIICCCPTSYWGVIGPSWRKWGKYWRFSSTKVIWSMLSTHHGGWWSFTTNRRNQRTESTEVISRREDHQPVSTSEPADHNYHLTRKASEGP